MVLKAPGASTLGAIEADQHPRKYGAEQAERDAGQSIVRDIKCQSPVQTIRKRCRCDRRNPHGALP